MHVIPCNLFPVQWSGILRHVEHQMLGSQGVMAPQKLYKGKLDVIPSIFTKVNGVKRISFSHLAWAIY